MNRTINIFAKVAVPLVLCLTVLRISFDIGYSFKAIGCTQYLAASCYISFLIEKLLFVAVGLMLIIFGLRLSRILGHVVTISGCGLVGASYYVWYLGTLSIMARAEVQNFSQMPNQQQHLITLLDATIWDIGILAFVFLVLIWQLATLWPLLTRRNPTENRKQSVGPATGIHPL